MKLDRDVFSFLLGKVECANNKLVWIMSVLFSIATITGAHYTNGLGFSQMSKVNLVLYVLAIVGFTFVSKMIFTLGYRFFEKWAIKEKQVENMPAKSRWKVWLFAFVVIMAGWLIVWLAYYPGLWNYDPYQVYQVMNGEYSKYHPLLHTLFLGWCYVYGLQQNDPNLGAIVYAQLQMMMMAGMFAYAYVYIKEHVSSKVFRAITLVFFTLFPVNSIMSISTTKDTLFAGFVLMALVLALEYFEKREKSLKISKIGVAGILFFVVLMMLYRNNAFYAFLVTLVITIGMFFLKQDVKKVVVFILICIMVYKSCDIGLTNALSAEDGPKGELFSVTSQQFGRIYTLVPEDVESRQMIEKFYRMPNAYYKPALSDTMKGQLINIDTTEGVLEYLKTAGQLFLRYPMVSIESFIYLTQGFWDVNDISHADIYDFYGVTSEYRFGYLCTTVFPEYGIVPQSKIPVLEAFLENAFTENAYQNIPLLPLIFAPASYVWFLLFGTVVILTKKNWNAMIVYSFLWGYMLTLFLGPCVLIRYVYLLVVSVPVQIYVLLHTISDKKLEEANG